jgi:dihydroorotase
MRGVLKTTNRNGEALMQTRKILRPSDFHSHLRSIAEIGEKAFEMVVLLNTQLYKYVVAEPNTYLDPSKPEHHIETAEDVERYRDYVERAKCPTCTVLYLIKITPRTTPEIVEAALNVGAIGGKLYPDGVTNNSEGGVTDFHSGQLYDCFGVLQERNAILQEHPELPGEFSMRREWRYGEVIRRHADAFPGLRIFAEHLTDRRSLPLLELPNVYGTITGHHLKLTLDDVLGCNEHHCRPNAKEPEDCEELISVAISGHWKVISITDSAFHKWWRKHLLPCGCAGVFNPAEVALPWLVTLFEKRGFGHTLEDFTSINGRRAYRLALPDKDDCIEFIQEPMKVPEMYFAERGLENVVIPFLAGETLPWRIAS